MSRSRLWMIAAVLAAGASGCAQCDTCNNPPTPCTGPGCSAALNVVPPPMMSGSPMPAMNPASGPFAAAPESGATPAFNAPALPDVPADAASPPVSPSAPDKP
jgi:hypothetical protein